MEDAGSSPVAPAITTMKHTRRDFAIAVAAVIVTLGSSKAQTFEEWLVARGYRPWNGHWISRDNRVLLTNELVKDNLLPLRSIVIDAERRDIAPDR